MSFSKKLLVLAVAAGLTACVGGSDDNDDKSPSTGGGSGASVSGAATKGIIIDGLVTAYPIENGVVDTSDPLANARTDAKGQYTLTLPAGYSGPVKVKITADANTRMKCDLSGGCGESAFGDPVPLESDFELAALIPQAAQNAKVSAQITPLTHMAAKLAEARSGGSGLNEDQILMANDQVAQLFELSSITDHEVVDVTDPQALASVDEQAQKAALLAAALAEAAQSETGGSDLSDSLDALVTSFVEANGQLVVNDTDGATPIISLQDIVERQAAVLAKVKEKAAESGQAVDLTVLESATNAKKEELDATTPDDNGLTEAKPSDNVLSDDLVKTKAFVADLRDLAYSTAGDSAKGKVVAGIDSFGQELELAAELVAEDTDTVLKVTAVAAAALAEAAEFIGTETDAHTYNTFVDGWGDVAIAVAIVENADNSYTLSINNQSVAGVAVDLSSRVTVDELTENETETGGAFSAAGNLALSGSVGNQAVELTIADGSRVVVSLVGSESYSETSTDGRWEEQETEDYRISTLELDLTVSLAQQQSAEPSGPVRFDGRLALTVDDFHEQGEGTYVHDGNSGSETYRDTTTFDSASLTLSGEFSNDSHSMAATLAISADGTGFQLVESGQWSWDISNGYHENTETTEEDADNFVKLGFTLSLEATLPGLSEEAKVTLTGNRETFDNATGRLEIAYEGKRIDAEFNPAERTVTVTNQDNVVLTLSEDEADVVSGAFTVDGVAYAQVRELDSGLIKISYSDGTFETLQ